MNRFSDFERNVMSWIADWLGNKPAQLSPDTCINFDLGVDGAGADKLIGFLAEKSGISFSGFPARDYFGPGLGSAAIFLYPFGPLIRRLSRQNRKKLTIRDMATYMYARSSREPRASSKVVNLDCFSRRLSA